MSKPSITILNSGTLKIVSTSPNEGMFYGNPYGGAMDYQAAHAANKILSQKQSLPVIECSLKAASLQFSSEMKISITGADMNWKLDGVKMKLNHKFKVDDGQILSGKFAKNGLRSYLAFDRKIIDQNENKIILGSKNKTTKKSIVSDCQLPINQIIKISKGPEWNLLDQEGKEAMITFQGKITQNIDRMGAYLKGNPILLNEVFPKMSVCTFPGVIQLLPNGQLIVLLQDAQTTGGYPRIAFLNKDSLCQFNQLMPGQKIEWRLTL